MRDRIEPERFFTAGAIDGRLRLCGLPPSGPWDPARLTYRTGEELETLFSRRGRGWVVLTVNELDDVLDCSWGIPIPITLYITDGLLHYVQRRWEGNVP